MSLKKFVICLTAAGFLAVTPLFPTQSHAESQVKSQQLSTPEPYPGHVIKYGDRGSDVKKVQQQLTRNLIPTTADGIFGKKTLENVKLFQHYRFLTEDGIVGPTTWNTLYQTSLPYPGHVTKKGDKGENVVNIQKRLKVVVGNITVDGDFGTKTEAKVKEFQKKMHLQVDGTVGRETWEVLFNYQE
ncbi:peptidoglycan-binding domain-containing protein [Fictibacillus sp. S7]|uniref:peptidoglycan-binding domain-containing protein n=1 Tax=Fictibacillus sp. S7 TaxID=2212476 RepID=UPI0010132622|nr:peptidoglycan-binding protein [Fictibacillus sp. S7]RXY99802.1 peptidoglycan-binding protein [Fictibacillus sp. S7]